MKLITFSRKAITKRTGAIVNEQEIDLHVAYKSLLTSQKEKSAPIKLLMHLFQPI